MTSVNQYTNYDQDLFSTFAEDKSQEPFFNPGRTTGFGSPAADFIELGISLDRELMPNPNSTYCGRFLDNAPEMGIDYGDYLVINMNLRPSEGMLAICRLNGKYFIRRLHIEKDYILLMPKNEKYKPIEVTADNDFVIWGIVTYVIKAV